jgi:hypothetical protein
MKTMLYLFVAAAFAGCYSEKDIQMNMVDVELIKIDTISRYPNMDKQLLTWRTPNQVNYITYEPLTTPYTIGSRMRVLVRK